MKETDTQTQNAPAVSSTDLFSLFDQAKVTITVTAKDGKEYVSCRQIQTNELKEGIIEAIPYFCSALDRTARNLKIQE